MLLFVTVLVLPLMLLFAGIAVDMAAYGTRDSQLQMCADSAALAAASSTFWVPPEPPETTGHWELELTQVETYKTLNCPSAALDAPTVSGQPPEVSVVLHAVSETSFLRVAGIQSLQVGAQAKAVRRNVLESERDLPGLSRLTQ